MKQHTFGFTAPFCLAGMIALAGCQKEAPHVEAVSAEEAPATIENAFADASGESKAAAQESAEALRGKDSATAFFSLQSLSSRSDLTPEQRQAAGRAMLTARQKLEEAAAAGDANAREAVERYRAGK